MTNACTQYSARSKQKPIQPSPVRASRMFIQLMRKPSRMRRVAIRVTGLKCDTGLPDRLHVTTLESAGLPNTNSARCAVASVGKAVIHESANRRCNQDFTLLQVSQPNSCSWRPMGLERQFLLTQPCHIQYLRLVLGFVMVKVLVRTSRKRAHECRLLNVSPTWSIKTHVRGSKGCITYR